jgi:two-component system cell cycle response regulator
MPRVLVIDDSSSVRAYVERMLSELGWQVATEESAELGAASALTSAPDLIISDLRMPGLSGLQLCRLLHEEPLTAHVPIVLMSATLDKRARYWALRSGAHAVVDKQQIAGLREIVARLPPQTAAAVKSRATPVSATEIPTRLSHLLDRALYQSAVATDLKSLSLAADLPELFAGTAQLLSTIANYEWLGLSVERGALNRACLHTHPSRREPDFERALAALGVSTMPPDPFLICDERCQAQRGPNSRAEAYAVSLAGTALGKLAVGTDPRIDGNEAGLFAFVASELTAPLCSVILTEEARRLAMTDALTGLNNRRCASDSLARTCAAAARYGTELSIALMDIDHFKRVNDEHGHETGDHALKFVAKILTRQARTSDVVARWGGEEFLHIMPNTGAAGARIAAERLRMALAAQPLTLEDGTGIRLAASFGVATRAGEEGPVQLLERADQALYRAKERGRNRVEVG